MSTTTNYKAKPGDTVQKVAATVSKHPTPPHPDLTTSIPRPASPPPRFWRSTKTSSQPQNWSSTESTSSL